MAHITHVMAKSLSLSDAAYRTLLADRRENESLSDVVLRLHAAAAEKRKDPLAFFRAKIPMELSPAEHLAWIQKGREADARRRRRLKRL